MSRPLKLGLNVGYWTGGPRPETLDEFLEAERLGFDSVWTSEAYGSDALTPLSWWGPAMTRSGSGGRSSRPSPAWRPADLSGR